MHFLYQAGFELNCDPNMIRFSLPHPLSLRMIDFFLLRDSILYYMIRSPRRFNQYVYGMCSDVFLHVHQIMAEHGSTGPGVLLFDWCFAAFSLKGTLIFSQHQKDMWKKILRYGLKHRGLLLSKNSPKSFAPTDLERYHLPLDG